MISSAILHECMGTCNCVVFKKLTNAYLHQLREKSCNLFLKIYMKRASQIVKTDEVLTARRYLYFALVLQLCARVK